MAVGGGVCPGCFVTELADVLGSKVGFFVIMSDQESEASADEFVYSSVDIQEEEGEEFKKFSDCCDCKKGKHW